ncbi:hypothetical protein L596_014722 [Steinernema carpocapsae]|uniref:Protein zwilch n=1 Tax=Steinernema carpocapsae TaxID=34508 RepID=A0A4U5NDJ8_STECR|nr:hypothetical protein L596_014722 [Steinernema carpocapsae]
MDQDTALSREQLEGEEAPLLFGKYRVRILNSSDVPVVFNISSLKDMEVIVIDLPTKEHVQTIPVAEMPAMEEGKMMPTMEGDISGPMKVSFLTMSKAEAEAGVADTSLNFNIDLVNTDGSTFSANPVVYRTAMTIRNRLYNEEKIFASDLQQLPVWVMTSAVDSLRTVMIGYHRGQKSTSTYAARFIGTGPTTVSVLDKIREDFLPGLPTKSVATCSYDIYRPQPAREDDLPERISASLSLSAKWSIRSNEVLTSPSATAPVTIRFCPGWLDSRLVLYNRSMELKLLIALSDALKNGTMIWPSADAQEDPNIVTEVNGLIRQEILSKNTYNSTGRYIDFTERLWDILKKCKTSTTLVAGLKQVFVALEGGELVVMLNKENCTTMARLLRSVNTDILSLPRLEALMPYQILLEIGLDRMKNDICRDFIESKMINSLTELTPLFKTTGQPETRVDSYIPVHLALQFMLECHQILHVTDHRRFQITRSVVAGYCQAQANTDMRSTPLDVSITIVDVRADVRKGITPSVWSMETTHFRGKVPVAQSTTIFTRRVLSDYFAGDPELEASNPELEASNPVAKVLIEDYDCSTVRTGILPVIQFPCRKS